MQGEGTADSVAAGIEVLDRLGYVDVIIAGRGGGSIEDLWAFNEEKVAYAIWNCNTPVISAVGHETDTTIADYVADLRAPTPSAGAELAVADMEETLLRLQEKRLRLSRLMKHRLDGSRQLAERYALKLQLKGPEGKLREGIHAIGKTRDKARRDILSASLNVGSEHFRGVRDRQTAVVYRQEPDYTGVSRYPYGTSVELWYVDADEVDVKKMIKEFQVDSSKILDDGYIDDGRPSPDEIEERDTWSW